MAGGINVGSVTATVVPDAENFFRDLSAKLNPQAARFGDDLGKRIAEAMQARLKASNPSLAVDADTGKARVEVDRFLADTKVKTAAASRSMGEDNGNLLATGMRNGIMRSSPLIVSAVAGGLIAGAPAALGAAGLLFGGIAAIAVKNNAQVHAATADMMNQVMGVFKDTAQVTVPMFVGALQRIGAAFQDLKPQFASAFSALGGPISSLTTGFIGLIQNAMPGLVSALKAASPVFQGLSDMMSRIGTGLGQFFALVSQHGSAAGQVFSSIGAILQELLPILGQLVGAGADLGSRILPPLASVLGVVAKALGLIAPVLPVVLAGFLGFKALSAVSGALDLLSAKLQTVAADGGRLTTSLAGNAAGAVSKLGAAVPVVGTAVGLLGLAFDAAHKDADNFRTSAEQLFTQLGQGGVAADQAQAKLALLQKAAAHPPPLNGWFSDSLSTSLSKGKQAAADAAEAMGPLAVAQQAVTQKTNDYLEAVGKYGKNSGQAAGAAVALSDAEGHLNTVQGEANDAAAVGASVTANLKSQLQLTADAAAAAKSQIKLLDDSLDALTGKTVTMDQAEVAITDATIAATSATKGKTGALVDATGALNLHTEAGAAAFTALNNLAGADNTLISTMEQQGKTSDEVKARDAQLRDSFIQTAEKMGFSAGQAQNLANQIYGIPAERNVQINTNAGIAGAAIKTLQDQIDNLHGRNVTIAILSAGNAGPAAYAVPGSNGGYAAGGYTGDGAKYTPAGIVHAGEFVFPQESVNRLGVGFLGALAGLPGYAGGGPVPIDIHETAAPFNQALQGAANAARDSIFSTAGSGGAARWAPVVLQALAMLGQSPALLGTVLRRMNQESGGNPTAVNLSDVNAARGTPSAGLMQTIGPTFTAYHFPGTSWSMFDPLANILASMDYALSRYGSLSAAYNRAGGYELGTNYVPHDGMAYLHRGEAVVPASQNQGAPYQGQPSVFHLYDSDGHLMGTMRGVAQQEAAGALTGVAQRMAY